MPSIDRRRWLRLAAVPLLALAVATTTPAFADRYEDRARYEERQRTGYNDEYVFAATKAVTSMEVSPVAKVPLIPLALVLDLVVLPFEIIAGVF